MEYTILNFLPMENTLLLHMARNLKFIRLQTGNGFIQIMSPPMTTLMFQYTISLGQETANDLSFQQAIVEEKKCMRAQIGLK